MNPIDVFNSGQVTDLKYVRTLDSQTLAAHGIKMDEAQEFFSDEWGMNFWAVKIDGQWQQSTGLELYALNKVK